MALINLIGLLTLTVAVSGNFIGSRFPYYDRLDGFSSQDLTFNGFPVISNSEAVQTSKVEKILPDGSFYTETIETLGGPNGGSSTKRQSSSAYSSSGSSAFQSSVAPSAISINQIDSSIPTGAQSIVTPTVQSYQSTDKFTPSFNPTSNFNNAYSDLKMNSVPESSAKSSSSHFSTSTSTRTDADGSVITETMTTDDRNPGKVTRMIKRVGVSGKETITYA